jgi:hypothetical protein
MTTVMVVVRVAIVVAVCTALKVHRLNREADVGTRILKGIEGFRYAW